MKLSLLFIALFFISIAALAADRPRAELIESRKIWDGAPHNAFTDLISRNGEWYCVFRESSAHIPGLNGKIRVLRSADGNAWQSAALVAEPGIDLRDPKITLTPDGRLMLLMGGSVYPGDEAIKNRKRTGAHSRVSFSKDAIEWTTPKPVEGIGNGQWLWQMTWHKGVGYGAVYSTAKEAGGKRTLSIWRTTDGVRYERMADPAPGIDLSEAAIRFDAADRMIVLLRGEEKDRHAWIGVSSPPYDKWQWKDGGHAAQGPNFIVLDDGRMFYAGRDFLEKGAARTVFGEMTLDHLTPLITFPSGGDTSYAGMVPGPGNEIWVSYYSSHEGKTAIYFAKVRLPAADN